MPESTSVPPTTGTQMAWEPKLERTTDLYGRRIDQQYDKKLSMIWRAHSRQDVEWSAAGLPGDSWAWAMSYTVRHVKRRVWADEQQGKRGRWTKANRRERRDGERREDQTRGWHQSGLIEKQVWRATVSRYRQKMDRSVRDEEDIVEKRQTPFATVQLDASHTGVRVEARIEEKRSRANRRGTRVIRREREERVAGSGTLYERRTQSIDEMFMSVGRRRAGVDIQSVASLRKNKRTASGVMQDFCASRWFSAHLVATSALRGEHLTTFPLHCTARLEAVESLVVRHATVGTSFARLGGRFSSGHSGERRSEGQARQRAGGDLPLEFEARHYVVRDALHAVGGLPVGLAARKAYGEEFPQQEDLRKCALNFVANHQSNSSSICRNIEGFVQVQELALGRIRFVGDECVGNVISLYSIDPPNRGVLGMSISEECSESGAHHDESHISAYTIITGTESRENWIDAQAEKVSSLASDLRVARSTHRDNKFDPVATPPKWFTCNFARASALNGGDDGEDISFVADPFPGGSSHSKSPVLQVTYGKGSYSKGGGGAQFTSLWSPPGDEKQYLVYSYFLLPDGLCDNKNSQFAISQGILQYRNSDDVYISGFYFSYVLFIRQYFASDSSYATPKETHSYFRNIQMWASTKAA
ncbi:hypothetical protein POSPLADRAFT_1043525 [Postia placenta MAD-698-R-SB12]|uniref:Uncharacterized protein n=1 Tax=Postia placenta MAD-698-R-SB12 TaxID=670580 RepID=A0A1X6NBP0_9APHY|nr:hypothetical protein POSPLADRAFT_1043525 [Postia placenta MAD-698-R-SB12]OSX65994.1 hypothetical protein POSPLADRAFT_1043525 [Postia placenta MAD-698-R-SB12]